jgi:Flp pilus assembly pilin Flp
MERVMLKNLRRLLANSSGATAVEAGMLAALIASELFATAHLVGVSL